MTAPTREELQSALENWLSVSLRQELAKFRAAALKQTTVSAELVDRALLRAAAHLVLAERTPAEAAEILRTLAEELEG